MKVEVIKMTLNTVLLKKINTELVKQALKDSDYSTKASIAEASGLSIATCRNILNELLGTGEVKEIELAASTGGRPSKRFIYNNEFAYIGTFSARKEGRTGSISANIYDMGGTIVAEEYREFETIGLEELDLVISHMIQRFDNIRVLALGIPGIIRNGTIGMCDFEKLSHIPVKEYIEEKWGRICVAENDVNAAALGYYQNRVSRSTESLAYIYYPKDGIAGAGIIINGKVLRGATNFAGEVSHLPLGTCPERQGAIQKDLEAFSSLIVKTLQSLNCTINPDTIVLSGIHFTDVLIEIIRESMISVFPADHRPPLVFENDIHNSYITGLKYLALKQLSCGFEVVPRI